MGARASIIVLLLAASACGSPKYPACDADADCRGRGDKDSGEVCLDRRCQECKADDACVKKHGPGATCKDHRCAIKSALAEQKEHGPEAFGPGGAGGAANASLAGCQDPLRPGKLALAAVSFDYDRAELRVDAQALLDQNAECLKVAPGPKVVVEGHCDERGTTEYNLSLGEDRAKSVIKYLRHKGVEDERLRPVTKGENEPRCQAATEDCHAKNRRVEFK